MHNFDNFQKQLDDYVDTEKVVTPTEVQYFLDIDYDKALVALSYINIIVNTEGEGVYKGHTFYVKPCSNGLSVIVFPIT